MKYFFTGCPHWGHANIIIYCKRPFKDLDEMHTVMRRNWNSRIKKGDVCIVIGDFAFKNSENNKNKGDGIPNKSEFYEEQLNGKTIFIQGNHDGNNGTKAIIRNMKIKLGGYIMNIVHDPKYVDFNVDLNLVSHVHTEWKFKRFFKGKKFVDAVNCGVDQWKFTPITIEEILSAYSKWKKTQPYNEVKNEVK
jgi:calcineurin-like phosphoesterase family protein